MRWGEYIMPHCSFSVAICISRVLVLNAFSSHDNGVDDEGDGDNDMMAMTIAMVMAKVVMPTEMITMVGMMMVMMTTMPMATTSPNGYGGEDVGGVDGNDDDDDGCGDGDDGKGDD